MHPSMNSLFLLKSLNFKQITRKVRLKIKAIILLGDSSRADKAVFPHCFTFIEFLGHLKGWKKDMPKVDDGHIYCLSQRESMKDCH